MERDERTKQTKNNKSEETSTKTTDIKDFNKTSSKQEGEFIAKSDSNRKYI